eukprot:Skav209595  [mRNA]  locus=scaffold1607:238500:252171:- [translate_table: standard]
MPEGGGSSTCAVLSVLVASISTLIFGVALGFTSPAIDVMQDTLEVNGKATSVPADLVVFDSQSQGSLFSSIVNFGALTGALLGGPLSQRIGRKRALLLQAPLYAIVWTATSFARSFALLMLTRFFTGVGIGLCSTAPRAKDTIFMSAGLKDADGLGFMAMVVQVAMTAVSIPLMDTGRPVRLLLCGMLLCCLGLATWRFRWPLAVACSFGYIAFFSLGLGPVPWLMMGEVFPGKIRSSASSLAAGLNWTCSFVTTETVRNLAG